MSPNVEAQNITDLDVMNDTAKVVAIGNVSEASTIDDSVFLHPERIKYDSRCWQIEGQDMFIYSGTFHYFRTPEPLWEDRMRKLRDAGFNCVETYIPWNWHERREPASVDDYSQVDLSQLDRFLTLAEQYGLYVIVRPGPYICAEWSGGGFPRWLMNKRPTKTLHDVWLQSIDPEFLRWNAHWYEAVCKVVRPHLITHRAKGAKGVILFQIENEFNRIKWFNHAEKKIYLEALARMARRGGIDVPLITCWTDEARNVSSGRLNGVVDMVNSYPRWNVEKAFGKLIDRQLKSQPGKPLLSGELQGGWCSEVGGKLPQDQEGLTPAQTQNITLYALQRGFSGLNYYMVVGGTNFDDWSARQQTVTYDYAAAIGEDGTLTGRYQRYQSLSAFIQEHGLRIARADIVPTDYQCTDPEVELTVRRCANGDAYYFVRTEEHTHPHTGHITIATSPLGEDGWGLDFSLEPFGSKVYYVAHGRKGGKWYPHTVTEPSTLPTTTVDTIPLQLKLRRGAMPQHSCFVYYQTKVNKGADLTIGRVGRNVINHSDADEVVAFCGGKQILPVAETDSSVTFHASGTVTFAYVSKGLHHHTCFAVERYWQVRPLFVRSGGRDIDYTEVAGKQRIAYTAHATFRKSSSSPTHLHLEHIGNGIIYVNGHCIGWCWERGPQRDYYIPDCWIDHEGKNEVSVYLLSESAQPTIQRAFLK